MYARINANGGNVSKDTINFTTLDYEEAATNNVSVRECKEWLRYITGYYNTEDKLRAFFNVASPIGASLVEVIDTLLRCFVDYCHS